MSWPRRKEPSVLRQVSIRAWHDPILNGGDDGGANGQPLRTAHRHNADTAAFGQCMIFCKRGYLRQEASEAPDPPRLDRLASEVALRSSLSVRTQHRRQPAPLSNGPIRFLGGLAAGMLVKRTCPHGLNQCPCPRSTTRPVGEIPLVCLKERLPKLDACHASAFEKTGSQKACPTPGAKSIRLAQASESRGFASNRKLAIRRRFAGSVAVCASQPLQDRNIRFRAHRAHS